jgi:hypothetical protein
MIITRDTHPTLIKACQIICGDNLYLESDLQIVTFREATKEDLLIAEGALNSLSEDDLESFCIGEFDTQQMMTSLEKGLDVADKILTEYFESLGDYNG